MSTNIGVEGIHSLLKTTNESNDNINRTTKQIHRTQSIHRNSLNRSGISLNIFDLIEQSLKQIDQYREKIKNSFIDKIPNKKSSTQIKTNNLIQFPPKPKIPEELFGKFNQNDLSSFIMNSNIDKSDGLFHFFFIL
jgi:hypothetical protein